MARPAGRFPLVPVVGSLAFALLSTAPLAGGALGAQEKAEPTFVDGQAQVVEGFRDPKAWIREELWVEAEFDSDDDGKRDRLHIDVTRPRQTDSEGLKLAVIYESSPYYAGTASDDKQFFWDPRQSIGGKPNERPHPPEIPYRKNSPRISESLIGEWVPRGFAVVHSEAPGTGQSQGAPTVGGPIEGLAPKAVIDWLNGRAKAFTAPSGGKEQKAYWSTGKVGMTGTSYNGTIPLAAACTGVDGLAAIIPVAPNTSYYRYYRSNGLVRHPGGWLGEDMDVLYDFIHSGDPKRRADNNKKVRDAVLLAHQDRVTGDYNDFWAGRDLWRELEKVEAACLFAHGLNDWNVMPEHSIHPYLVLKERGVPVQLFLHQGGHGGDPPHAQMNRWFTRWLYDVENGVEDDPRCSVVREGARRGEPTPYPDYPNPGSAAVIVRPGKGGDAIGPLAIDGAPVAAIEKLVDDVAVSGSDLAKAERSPHRLLYALPALKEPLHLSGTPRLTVRLASSKPATNFSVWLVALPWTATRDLNMNLISRGWADPQNRNSLTSSAPLAPGEFVDLAFDLQPDDQVIPAGEQIALLLFASDQDFTLWPPAGTELSIDLAGTALSLPVVGGKAALLQALGTPGG
ncbi:MAG: Xaa-Pro dipeptidyl-peptidase [Planctomycetes bacterium]|nr:Xaa-Pro dipeptidyl-peptidase [Planctomycetota bacterium]